MDRAKSVNHRIRRIHGTHPLRSNRYVSFRSMSEIPTYFFTHKSGNHPALRRKVRSAIDLLAKLKLLCQFVFVHKRRKPHQTTQEQQVRKIVAVDLFCGAGGLTRGLLDAGIEVVAGYDIDPACQFPYEHNNEPAKFHKKSVTELTGEELAKHYPEGYIKVLVGCAPCQTFSKYTQGLDNEDDPKWTLLNHFARLIQELKPDIVSMENVPELQHYPVFDSFLKMLKAEGFHFVEEAEKQVVYCPDYGMAQHRSRVVIVASKLSPIKLIPKTHTTKKHRNVASVLRSLPRLKAGETHPGDPLHRCSKLSALNLKRIKHSKPGGTWRDWPEELVAECHRKESGKSYPSVYARMEWDKPSPTMTTQFYGYGNGRFGHPDQDRAISLREGAILQSFPENYKFVEPDGEYCIRIIGRMIGNAVPVRLGEIVGKTIKKHLKNQNVQA